MKKIISILMIFALSACGTMGIGRNDYVQIFNHSDSEINVTGSNGVVKIPPKSSSAIGGKGLLEINPKDKKCEPAFIKQSLNYVAVILDIFPGMLLLYAPLGIDAITGNLSRFQESYIYDC